MAEEGLAIPAVGKTVVDEEAPLVRDAAAGGSGYGAVGRGGDGPEAAERGDGDAEGKRGDSSLVQVSRRKLVTILSAMLIGTFLSALDQTLITTLLTPISNTFASFSNISWVATAYLIATAALQPLFGKLTDIFGRRNGLIVCNVLFGLGTLWCGLAGGVAGMVGGRIVAGMGGGGLTTIAVMTVSDIVPLRDRGVVQGVSNIVFGVGSGLGGLFGGFVNDTLGWRWAFLLQVPVIVFSAVVVMKVLKLPSNQPISPPEPTPPGAHATAARSQSGFERVDYAGSITLVTALVLLLTALNSGGNVVPWTHPVIRSSLALAGVFLGLFVYVEGYVAKEPIIPLGLLADKSVLSACLVNWFMVMAVYSILFYLPIFHLLTSHTTTTSGLLLSPFSIGISFGSLTSGFLIRRTGEYRLLSFFLVTLLLLSSLILTTYTSTCTTTVSSPHVHNYHHHLSNSPSSPPLSLQLPNLFLTGFAYGGTLTATLVALLASVRHESQALVTSASYLFRATGSTIGVALSGAIFQNFLRTELYSRLGGQGPEAVEWIERVRRSFEDVKDVPEIWRGEVVRGLLGALGGVWWFVVGMSAVALVCAGGIRERSLGNGRATR
ncbi:major facilitator superfamily domain-containing protein [Kalaharituber pfeilii]|nr:major facilitator superfamily domain-containing protein [Kalaharituber pfeilii]